MLGGAGCSALDLGQVGGHVVGGPAGAGDEGRGLRELVESRAGSTGGIGPPGCPAGGAGAAAGGGIGRRGALGRNTQGKVVATSAMAFPCTSMYAAFFAFQALRSQAGSSQLNRVVRADRPTAGHSARVRLTSTVSTSARTASWFVAHPYWVAPEENSRMLAPCELRVVAPTCNVKPTGRALSTVR